MIMKFFSVWLLSMCFASNIVINHFPAGEDQIMLERMPRYVTSAVSHSGLHGPTDDLNRVIHKESLRS